jgi:hypothetical protein
MNMQIHKSRRNISIGDGDGSQDRRSGAVAIYAYDPPVQNLHAGVFQHAIRENEISSNTKIGGHSFSIEVVAD